MSTPTQAQIIPKVSNVPTLQGKGAYPYGSHSEAWPANPTQATITATGTLPNRPAGTGIPTDTPQYFEFLITAAAAVTLTMPDGGNYVDGDVVNVISRATLANAVTIQDAHGPTTLGGLPTTGTASYCKMRYVATATVFWQVIGIGGG